jgi:Na+-transporting NADH:ubiquinone oxidoreductase subunit B
MKLLRKILDSQHERFTSGSLKRLFPLYESADTFLYQTGATTSGATHVRDALDLKRMMTTVVLALMPCVLMACYNTGYQANLIYAQGVISPEGWRHYIVSLLGIGHDPSNILACFFLGALFFAPIYIVCNVVGGFWEVLFAIVRKHEVNEGFFVTGFLFPLTLPPTIPLWQVAIGITFGVVIAKELFGGTGRNFMNPALAARAFLYFAYPAQISGDAVWTAVDGFTAATPLSVAAAEGFRAINITWSQAFLGLQNGSIGETSDLACLIGAAFLIASGIGSWKIIFSCIAGFAATITLFNVIGSTTNPMFSLPLHWHLVLGGFSFGCVFMATDPVSACFNEKAKLIYGLFIGFICALVRVVNPAFPEGMMLAILLANIFAPIIDYIFVGLNIERRKRREAYDV